MVKYEGNGLLNPLEDYIVQRADFLLNTQLSIGLFSLPSFSCYFYVFVRNLYVEILLNCYSHRHSVALHRRLVLVSIDFQPGHPHACIDFDVLRP